MKNKYTCSQTLKMLSLSRILPHYFWLKVKKSWKQSMVSSILPKTNKNHYPEHFSHIEMPRIVSLVHFFGKIEDTIICFRDFLTFNSCLDDKQHQYKYLDTNPTIYMALSSKYLCCNLRKYLGMNFKVMQHN